MKYFLDAEFIEGPQKERFPINLFRKHTKPTIDLISIGIVAEDGREYYAISKDFNLKEAWNRFQVEEQTAFEKYHQFSGRKNYWIRDNVLKPIFSQYYIEVFECNRPAFSYSSMKYLIDAIGKSNKEISVEIISFATKIKWQDNSNGRFNVGTDLSNEVNKKDFVWDNPEFYAYYADYDWVVFCWLFGKMMDLPKGFPMYCKDLKQLIDEKFPNGDYDCKDLGIIKIKNHFMYPKQENEHDALSDALWNKKLFEFLNNL